MYYILKPKEIHSLPQSKVYLLVPESLRKLVTFSVQLTVSDKVSEALKKAY